MVNKNRWTVDIGTDQNIKMEILAEYKIIYMYTTRISSQKKNILIVCEIWRVFKVVLWWVWTKWHTLGANFTKHVLAKTTCTTIITEDVNHVGEFQNSAPITFNDSSRAVLYATNAGFSSNACRKLIAHTTKNPQHGIRAQMVLKLTNKLQMAEIKTDSCIDV